MHRKRSSLLLTPRLWNIMQLWYNTKQQTIYKSTDCIFCTLSCIQNLMTQSIWTVYKEFHTVCSAIYFVCPHKHFTTTSSIRSYHCLRCLICSISLNDARSFQQKAPCLWVQPRSRKPAFYQSASLRFTNLQACVLHRPCLGCVWYKIIFIFGPRFMQKWIVWVDADYPIPTKQKQS